MLHAEVNSFSNSIKTSFDPSFQNPCDSPAPRILFKEQKVIRRDILVADRLKEYIRDKGIKPDERIFPVRLTRSHALRGNEQQSNPQSKGSDQKSSKSLSSKGMTSSGFTFFRAGCFFLGAARAL